MAQEATVTSGACSVDALEERLPLDSSGGAVASAIMRYGFKRDDGGLCISPVPNTYGEWVSMPSGRLRETAG
jgi:hypothetical protein